MHTERDTQREERGKRARARERERERERENDQEAKKVDSQAAQTSAKERSRGEE